MPNKHPFHIVDNSPWPVMASINLMNLMVAFLAFSKTSNTKFLMLSFITMNSLALNSYCWWRDTSREGSLLGHHTHKVYKGLKIGISLFILSEIMFFMSFFWTFFHFSLAPDFEISNTWPPTGITPLNPYQIPLLNTTILLSSGVTITWAHNAIMMKKSLATKFALYLTIMLGMVFSSLQMWEYFWSSFSMNDSAFGSIFYLATGFHGLHVIIGTIFLITSLCRISTNLVNNKHHFNLEASAWYWHFVDVVWIFLYVFMYWWFF